MSRCRAAATTHGLQVDATAGLVSVTCVDNETLLVLDRAGLDVLARFTIGADVDVLALDEPGRRLDIAVESGVVAMFAIDGRSLHKLGQQHLAAKPGSTDSTLTSGC